MHQPLIQYQNVDRSFFHFITNHAFDRLYNRYLH